MATNYEQAGIEAVNRLFRPMAEGMETQQQLQRQAAGLGLQRQLQLDDAATKRQQELDDAATTRAQQVSDATLAHERGLDRITHQIQETADTAEDTAKKRRAEKLKDDKDEAVAMWNSLSKKGIHTGVSVSEINNASRGELNSILRDLGLESEIVKLNKKPHAELLERLRSIERTDEGKDILQQLWDTADAIDWEEVAKESKSTLADVLGEATIKLNLQKYGKGPVIEYKNLRVIQHKLMQETGIYDLMMEASPTNESAAKAIANDVQFQMGLTQALKDGWMPGDDRPEKANRILDLLQGGQLVAAAQMLDNEGVAGNTPLIEAYTKWAATSQVAQQAKIQDRIFRSQGSIQKLREVNQQLNGLVSRHDWLERAVDLTDIPEIMDDLQGMQGGGVNPPVSMEPGDPGFGDTGTGAGTGGGGGGANNLVTPTALNNLVNPQATSEATQTSSPSWVQNQPDYTETPFLPDVVPNPLTFNRKNWTPPTPEDYKDINLSIVGSSSLATRDMSQDRMSKPTQGWFGRKATELKQAVAPRTDLSWISPSMAPLYDEVEDDSLLYSSSVNPGGIGDVAFEMAKLAGMSWLGTKGFQMLGKSPAALKRIRDLSKAHPGGIPVSELVKGLGSGAALESFKAFLKNPKKMKAIADQIKQSAPFRSRMHGGGAKPYELIPKQRRLDFTRPSSGEPIITPPPTP